MTTPLLFVVKMGYICSFFAPDWCRNVWFWKQQKDILLINTVNTELNGAALTRASVIKRLGSTEGTDKGNKSIWRVKGWEQPCIANKQWGVKVWQSAPTVRICTHFRCFWWQSNEGVWEQEEEAVPPAWQVRRPRHATTPFTTCLCRNVSPAVLWKSCHLQTGTSLCICENKLLYFHIKLRMLRFIYLKGTFITGCQEVKDGCRCFCPCLHLQNISGTIGSILMKFSESNPWIGIYSWLKALPHKDL